MTPSEFSDLLAAVLELTPDAIPFSGGAEMPNDEAGWTAYQLGAGAGMAAMQAAVLALIESRPASREADPQPYGEVIERWLASDHWSAESLRRALDAGGWSIVAKDDGGPDPLGEAWLRDHPPASPEAGLDMERLARAIGNVPHGSSFHEQLSGAHIPWMRLDDRAQGHTRDFAHKLAAEYARLDSATEE